LMANRSQISAVCTLKKTGNMRWLFSEADAGNTQQQKCHKRTSKKFDFISSN
jgi:hypothetical protein